MKRLISPTGKPVFVADALVPTYLKKGYKEDLPAPPQTDPPASEIDHPASETTPSDGESNQEAEEFRCPFCDKVYKTKAGLDKHIAEKHPEA